MSLKNVVLVTVDCLRYDKCGFNGYSRGTTPSLDKLATESVVFENPFATGPYTPESFPGLLAGRHGHESEFVSDIVFKSIPQDADTVASTLRDEGYDTMATITNPHLTRDRNYDHGFDSFQNLRVERRGRQYATREDGGQSEGFRSALLGRLSTALGRQSSDLSSRLLVSAFLAYRYYQSLTDWPTIDGETVSEAFNEELAAADAPFFAWTHFMDLHGPLRSRSVKAGGLGVSALRQYAGDSRRVRDRLTPLHDYRYDAVLRYVDERIGEIVADLKDRGVWEETLFVVTGDHGEALFDRGAYGHPRHYMYDELLRVPLIVRHPDLDADIVDDQFSLAWMKDLLTAALGLDTATTDTAVAVDSAEVTVANRPVIADSISAVGHTVAVREGGYKYIEHVGNGDEFADAYAGGVGYHMRQDRAEQCPLPPEAVPESLHDQVRALHTTPDALTRRKHTIDRDVEKRLTELGYKT